MTSIIFRILATTVFSAFAMPAFAQLNVNGTGAPDASAALQVSAGSGATKKGFLLPSVSLSSTTDAAVVTNPATGLMVYNTNASITNGNGVGIYYNTGTPAVPVWSSLQVANNGNSGSRITYTGPITATTTTDSEACIGVYCFRYFSTTNNAAGILQVRQTTGHSLYGTSFSFYGVGTPPIGSGTDTIAITTYASGVWGTAYNFGARNTGGVMTVLNFFDNTNNTVISFTITAQAFDSRDVGNPLRDVFFYNVVRN